MIARNQLDRRTMLAPGAAEPSPANTLYACIDKRFDSGFSVGAEFILRPGITVLFGASGSGKTTILDSLAGLCTPDAGRITVNDRVLFDRETRTRAHVDVRPEHRLVGYLFQSLALFPHLTAAENIAYGLAGLPRDERQHRTSGILQSFRIGHCASRRPAQISGGERQRVALARALVTDPRYLLLDEPLSGLDAPTKNSIIDDLRRWNRDHRIPILYVTHDRQEVYSLAERVIVLDQGRVLSEGVAHEVLEAPVHETIAQLVGFENVFDCIVQGLNDEQGSMTCRLLPHLGDAASALATVFAPEGTSAPVLLEVPLVRSEAGQRLRVGVRAGDILLATRKPESISARNLLAGDVRTLTRRDFVITATIACAADPAVVFDVHLTPAAVNSLHLEPGTPVWLVIKTHSCHLLRK